MSLASWPQPQPFLGIPQAILVSDITGHISDANCFRHGNSNPLFIDGRNGPLIIDYLPDLAICLLFTCPLQAAHWPFASHLGLYNTRCSAVSWQNQNAIIPQF